MANRRLPRTAWKPGQSGNPNGRPKKGKTLSDILEKHGAKRIVKTTGPDGEIKYISQKEALAKKLWELAITGDVAAIKYIYDRIDGKPTESIDFMQIDPQPIVVERDDD